MFRAKVLFFTFIFCVPSDISKFETLKFMLLEIRSFFTDISVLLSISFAEIKNASSLKLPEILALAILYVEVEAYSLFPTL